MRGSRWRFHLTRNRRRTIPVGTDDVLDDAEKAVGALERVTGELPDGQVRTYLQGALGLTRLALAELAGAGAPLRLVTPRTIPAPAPAPLGEYARVCRLFCDAWAHVVRSHAARLEEQRARLAARFLEPGEIDRIVADIRNTGVLRGFTYDDNLARTIAGVATRDLTARSAELCEGMRTYLTRRGTHHPDWIGTADEWRSFWALVRQIQDSEDTAGTIAEWEDLVTHPHVLEIFTVTTSTDLATTTMTTLAGLAAFFDTEADRLAS